MPSSKRLLTERIMSQLHEPPGEAEITLLQQKAKKEKEKRSLKRLLLFFLLFYFNFGSFIAFYI